jgi:hypothetical protein
VAELVDAPDSKFVYARIVTFRSSPISVDLYCIIGGSGSFRPVAYRPMVASSGPIW